MGAMPLGGTGPNDGCMKRLISSGLPCMGIIRGKLLPWAIGGCIQFPYRLAKTDTKKDKHSQIQSLVKIKNVNIQILKKQKLGKALDLISKFCSSLLNELFPICY